MKTLVDVVITQAMTVLVESEDTADKIEIENAVDDAFSEGLLYEFALDTIEQEARVLHSIRSDASEAEKERFEREVSYSVDNKNKFTLNELLGEEE